MREIKFRAWDKEYFRFHRIESIEFLDGEIENVIIQNYMPIHISKIELMQYTGLKDKNGVEIYEGDIVRHIDTKHEVAFVGSIKYESGCFYVHNTFNKFDSWVFDYDYEVIGNIYENPELLK